MGVCREPARFLFAIEDDIGNVALSAECEGSIWMAVADLEHSREMLTWRKVVGPEDTDGARIADHWHAFAQSAWHGFGQPIRLQYIG